MHIAMHTYTYQVRIQHVLLIMWGFSILVLQNSGKIFKFKGHFYFKQTILQHNVANPMTARKYKKLQAIFLFFEIRKLGKHHQTFS